MDGDRAADCLPLVLGLDHRRLSHCMVARMTDAQLFYAVHGRKPPRRAPRAARRGPARSSKYKAWIRTLACAACGTTKEIEAAHTGSDGGTAQKASDYSCIPLCADCHQFAADSYHRDRACCERRIVARSDMTIIDLVKDLNGTWARRAA